MPGSTGSSPRCLIVFKDADETEIATLFRQFDGNPAKIGNELRTLLADLWLVQGITNQNERRKVAKGMGCLAAQVVKHLKNNPGEVYLHPAGTRNIGEEYIYAIAPPMKVQAGTNGTLPRVTVTTDKDTELLFEGTFNEFDWNKAEVMAQKFANA